MKIEINEAIPAELEGKTFEEVFRIVKERNHEVIEKIKAKFGNTTFTPEVEKFLDTNENMYIRLAQSFKDPLNFWLK